MYLLFVCFFYWREVPPVPPDVAAAGAVAFVSLPVPEKAKEIILAVYFSMLKQTMLQPGTSVNFNKKELLHCNLKT